MYIYPKFKNIIEYLEKKGFQVEKKIEDYNMIQVNRSSDYSIEYENGKEYIAEDVECIFYQEVELSE